MDDVAAAHVLAMINPAATGRFIVSAESAFVLDWLRELRPRYPGVWLPRFVAPRWLLWLVCKLSSVYPWDLVDSTYGKVRRYLSAVGTVSWALGW